MVINLRRTQGFAAAVAVIGSGPDERDTEFQALVTKLQDEEVRLRTQRVENTEQYLSQTKTILFLEPSWGYSSPASRHGLQCAIVTNAQRQRKRSSKAKRNTGRSWTGTGLRHLHA